MEVPSSKKALCDSAEILITYNAFFLLKRAIAHNELSAKLELGKTRSQAGSSGSKRNEELCDRSFLIELAGGGDRSFPMKLASGGDRSFPIELASGGDRSLFA
jgi:hypothetical protein